MVLRFWTYAMCVASLVACGGGQTTNNGTSEPATTQTQLVSPPDFVADSAMAYVREQCAFGARVPGTEAHRLCGDYLVSRFEQFGLTVRQQHATLTAWNGDQLPMRNIMASYNAEATVRMLITAHWDSRPWADHDPDNANHNTPVMGANDGASGVAVMLEMARVLSTADQPLSDVGVDFVCFDCEDYGAPQWVDEPHDDTWCLGSTYWAQHPIDGYYQALWGINLDMVGGRDTKFAREGISLYFARPVVERTWHIAAQLGYEHLFVNSDGGYVTDDHRPINQYLGIPTIDIVPYSDSPDGSFCSTWHTVNDTPDNIDPNTMAAVGRVVLTLLYNR